jgi:hypothetical protein
MSLELEQLQMRKTTEIYTLVRSTRRWMDLTSEELSGVLSGHMKPNYNTIGKVSTLDLKPFRQLQYYYMLSINQ